MNNPFALGGTSAYRIVFSEEEFDRYIAESFPQLLNRATMQTRSFLRETGQWENDIVHNKMAQRWGYELLERFILSARRDVPCRPIHLLDSYVFRFYSQARASLAHDDLGTPICRFLDGLFSRAVHSRDAMTAIFYHLYGLGQQHVAKLLALGSVESQRVYKNYVRWRSTGWASMVEEVGLKESELNDILQQKRRNPVRFHTEVQNVMHRLQAHYRKSEPEHYACLTSSEWDEIYAQNRGYDYKGWHLPFCHSCFSEVWNLRQLEFHEKSEPNLNLHVHPLPKSGVLESRLAEQEA